MKSKYWVILALDGKYLPGDAETVQKYCHYTGNICNGTPILKLYELYTINIANETSILQKYSLKVGNICIETSILYKYWFKIGNSCNEINACYKNILFAFVTISYETSIL